MRNACIVQHVEHVVRAITYTLQLALSTRSQSPKQSFERVSVGVPGVAVVSLNLAQSKKVIIVTRVSVNSSKILKYKITITTKKQSFSVLLPYLASIFTSIKFVTAQISKEQTK